MAKTKAKKKARQRTPLTKSRVITQARALADTNGIESLSMRKIAQRLGVEAMSLYNHVTNKDEILDGLVELVISEIEVPGTDDDWRAAMRRRAHSAHEVLMRHRWATLLMMSRVNIGPAALTYVNATLGCLRAAGFSFPLADYAWNAMDSFIYGFTLQKLNFPFEPDEYSDAAEAFTPQLPMDRYPHLLGLSIEVMEKRHDGVQNLSFGLELLLDGLEGLRANAR